MISIYSAVDGSQTESRLANDIISSGHVDRLEYDAADSIQNYVPLVAQMASCIIE